jgi:hypothetical protein
VFQRSNKDGWVGARFSGNSSVRGSLSIVWLEVRLLATLMAKKITSPTLLAAQLEYYKQNNIQVKKEDIVEEKKKEEGLGLGGMKDFGIYISNINKMKALQYMEDKEVIQLILKKYDEVLNRIVKDDMKDDYNRMINYIEDNNCEHGICKYSRIILGVAVAERWWITQFQRAPDSFWANVPRRCFSTESIINAISFRVNKLTEILNSIQ